eukprot:gene601-8106_t
MLELEEERKINVTIIDDNAFELPERYTVTHILGNGGYGVVASGFDIVTKQKVAIKKLPAIFERNNEFQKRILREIKVMKFATGHPNIVSLLDLIEPPSYKEFKDVYIVMELMDSDLKTLLRGNQEMNDENVKYFLYNILSGLHYLHSANILHRDLKPENILLNKDMEVKLCDFGLSRGMDDSDEQVHATQYVATRYYRAPELLLYYGSNSKALDIWSVGCILGEFLQRGKRHPIFPGKDFKSQLLLIVKTLGTPAKEDIKASQSAAKFMNGLPKLSKKDFSLKFPNANPNALELLDDLLQFNPDKRPSVEEALRHNYLEEIFDTDDIQSSDSPFEDALKINETDPEFLKKLIFEEIMEWRKNEDKMEIEK